MMSDSLRAAYMQRVTELAEELDRVLARYAVEGGYYVPSVSEEDAQRMGTLEEAQTVAAKETPHGFRSPALRQNMKVVREKA